MESGVTLFLEDNFQMGVIDQTLSEIQTSWKTLMTQGNCSCDVTMQYVADLLLHMPYMWSNKLFKNACCNAFSMGNDNSLKNVGFGNINFLLEWLMANFYLSLLFLILVFHTGSRTTKKVPTWWDLMQLGMVYLLISY